MISPEQKQRTGMTAIAVTCLIVGGLLGMQAGRWTQGRSILTSSPRLALSNTGTATTGTVLGMGQLPDPSVAQDVDFRQFWNLWQLLKQKYYRQPLEDKQLFYGAMNGLAAAAADPYTMYFEPKLAEDFQQSLSGKFEGIGAELGLKDDQLQIIAPLPDTPAERAGIMAGDYIVKIDGKDTAGMSVERAVSIIRGKKGTSVTLTVFRPSEPKKAPFDVSIIRDEIQVKSVNLKMLDGGIAKIEVTHFNEDTQAGFDQAVAQALNQKAKGIILDLRNNPGGFLDTSLAMAGEWVGDQVVVKERRQGTIFEQLRGTGKGRLANLPTVVLVNQGSASASEIVSGALQDYKKATLVGTKTYGKGSVQDYQNFNDGSGVKITIAEWLTPNERTINKTGLEPDVKVERTAEDYEKQRDPQLDKALEILTGKSPAADRATSSTKP